MCGRNFSLPFDLPSYFCPMFFFFVPLLSFFSLEVKGRERDWERERKKESSLSRNHHLLHSLPSSHNGTSTFCVHVYVRACMSFYFGERARGNGILAMHNFYKNHSNTLSWVVFRRKKALWQFHVFLLFCIINTFLLSSKYKNWRSKKKGGEEKAHNRLLSRIQMMYRLSMRHLILSHLTTPIRSLLFNKWHFLHGECASRMCLLNIPLCCVVVTFRTK